MSRRPNVRTMAATASRTSGSLVTLPWRAKACPPFRSMSLTTRSNSSFRRPVIATFAPSRAKTFAIASPMPVPPPVTIAALCSSLMDVSSLNVASAFLFLCTHDSFHNALVQTSRRHQLGAFPMHPTEQDFSILVDERDRRQIDAHGMNLLSGGSRTPAAFQLPYPRTREFSFQPEGRHTGGHLHGNFQHDVLLTPSKPQRQYSANPNRVRTR